jgi:hypothetical protein
MRLPPAAALLALAACTEPPRTPDPPPAIVGRCAYNPSDSAHLGTVIAVGPAGVNAYGEAEPGQYAATVRLTAERAARVGKPTTVATYPRFLLVGYCGTGPA